MELYRRHLERPLAFLIALMMFLSTLMVMPALADEEEPLEPVAVAEAKSPELIAAETLHRLGLFLGYGDNEEGKPVFGLEDGATRLHGIIMLLRFLGEYAEAQKGNYTCPFTDVVGSYNRAIAGFAFAKGYTKGISETRFDPTAAITTTQYLTFILRALGYKDGEDFEWNTAWELADKLGITNGEYSADNNSFLRKNLVLITLFTLNQPLKGGEKTLIDVLITTGVFETLKLEPDEIVALVTETIKSIAAPANEPKAPEPPLAEIPLSGGSGGSSNSSGSGGDARNVYITGVTISGGPIAGSTLIATPTVNGTPKPVVTYQWQVSDDGEHWTDINGATSENYVAQKVDEDKYIKVKAFQSGANNSPFESNKHRILPPASIDEIIITSATTITVPLTHSNGITYADFKLCVDSEGIQIELTGVPGTSPAQNQFAIAGFYHEIVYIVLGSALKNGDILTVSASNESTHIQQGISHTCMRVEPTGIISNAITTRIDEHTAEFRFFANRNGVCFIVVVPADNSALNEFQVVCISQGLEVDQYYTEDVTDIKACSIDYGDRNIFTFNLGENSGYGDRFTLYYVTTDENKNQSDVVSIDISATQEEPIYSLEPNTAYFAEYVHNKIMLTSVATANTNVKNSVYLDFTKNDPFDPDDPDAPSWGLFSTVYSVLAATGGFESNAFFKSVIFTTADTPDFQTAIPKIEIVNDVTIFSGRITILDNMTLETENINVTVSSGAYVTINNIAIDNHHNFDWEDETEDIIETGVPVLVKYAGGMTIIDKLGYTVDTRYILYIRFVENEYNNGIQTYIEGNGVTIDASKLGDADEFGFYIPEDGSTVRFDVGIGNVAESGENGIITVGEQGAGLIFRLLDYCPGSLAATSDNPDHYFTYTSQNVADSDFYPYVTIVVENWE